MSRKLGRNDACWCGSGAKYKKCHLIRERQAPLGIHDVHTELQEAFGVEMCMHPNAPHDCEGQIIKAHSVARGGSLAKIARDSKVYQVRTSFPEMMRSDGNLAPKLTSIKSASVFTGFCAKHDRDVFSPIENRELVFDPQQCMLLGLRALKAEFFWKQAQQRSSSTLRKSDRGKAIREQFFVQNLAQSLDQGVERAIQDYSYSANIYDQSLTSGDYSNLRYRVILFDKIPKVLCSTCFAPEVDFEDRIIQNMSALDQDLDLITLSVVPTTSGGAAVFSWANTPHGANEQFIDSLNKTATKDIADAIIRVCFEHSDNLYIEPVWWESLIPEVQGVYVNRIASGSLRDSSLSLKDDGIRAADWQAEP